MLFFRLVMMGFLTLLATLPLRADGLIHFRIATGGTGATYYPVAALMASAISNPPGGLACDKGGACGVPNLLVSALSSFGSVHNVKLLGQNAVESAFVQADIAYWAQNGQAMFKDHPHPNLRAIANLYPEEMHVVVRKDSKISTLSDLRGKRVSLDMAGSGTRADALMVLGAAGVDQNDMELFDFSLDQAAKALDLDQVDAFFYFGGYPSPAISRLASQSEIRLVPIDDNIIDQLAQKSGFFAKAKIPAGTYPGLDQAINTLSVGAIWVTDADQDADLIHAITRVLWNDNTLSKMGQGHPTGRRMLRENALMGLGLPLHPGAERYYRQAGLLD